MQEVVDGGQGSEPANRLQELDERVFCVVADDAVERAVLESGGKNVVGRQGSCGSAGRDVNVGHGCANAWNESEHAGHDLGEGDAEAHRAWPGCLHGGDGVPVYRLVEC